MAIMEMKGTISVKVTPEDMAASKRDKRHDFASKSLYVQAMVTATFLPDVRALNSQLQANGYCLHYLSCSEVKDGAVIVCFQIDKRGAFPRE